MNQTATQSPATAGGKPPLAPGLPVLGNALSMRIDPLAYLLKLYGEYGPVFRVRMLSREYTIMAGLDANRFLAREAGEYLGSVELFGGFARELGSEAFMVALDGVPHRHQRKVQRRGYGREILLGRIGEVVELTNSSTRDWKEGTTFSVFPTVQRIITEQLGILLASQPCGDYFESLWTLLNTNMKVHVMKTHPKFMLRLPAYTRARARSRELARNVLAWHRAHPPTDRPADLLDDLVAGVDENGLPYTEPTLIAATLGPYFAGMDTVASTASFMLYAILHYPGVLARVQAEVDAAFAAGGGTLTVEALKGMSALHGAAMETLRMYPVAPFTPRTVTQPFEFGGYAFTPGTEVMVANALTQYLPEYFPEPERFDIDRHARADRPKVPNTYAPFTLGSHTCLGAGMAESQLMVVIATLLRHFEFALPSPDYRVEIQAAPIPNPGKGLTVKVVRRRLV
jgi:cytochrome P450